MNMKVHKFLLRISQRKFECLETEAKELDISINSLIKLKLDNKIKG